MAEQTMRWKAGDKILFRRDGYAMVVREIVAVRPGQGYDWRYPSMGDTTPIGGPNLFCSENSNDPLMLMGWEIWDQDRSRRATEGWHRQMDAFLKVKADG